MSKKGQPQKKKKTEANWEDLPVELLFNVLGFNGAIYPKDMKMTIKEWVNLLKYYKNKQGMNTILRSEEYISMIKWILPLDLTVKKPIEIYKPPVHFKFAKSFEFQVTVSSTPILTPLQYILERLPLLEYLKIQFIHQNNTDHLETFDFISTGITKMDKLKHFELDIQNAHKTQGFLDLAKLPSGLEELTIRSKYRLVGIINHNEKKNLKKLTYIYEAPTNDNQGDEDDENYKFNDAFFILAEDGISFSPDKKAYVDDVTYICEHIGKYECIFEPVLDVYGTLRLGGFFLNWDFTGISEIRHLILESTNDIDYWDTIVGESPKVTEVTFNYDVYDAKYSDFEDDFIDKLKESSITKINLLYPYTLPKKIIGKIQSAGVKYTRVDENGVKIVEVAPEFEHNVFGDNSFGDSFEEITDPTKSRVFGDRTYKDYLSNNTNWLE